MNKLKNIRMGDLRGLSDLRSQVIEHFSQLKDYVQNNTQELNNMKTAAINLKNRVDTMESDLNTAKTFVQNLNARVTALENA